MSARDANDPSLRSPKLDQRRMIVPHLQLLPATLRAIAVEFVTRDGTDHSIVETRVEQILAQLAAERLDLHFDDASQSCNFVLKN